MEKTKIDFCVGRWTAEERKIFEESYQELGNRWKKISERLGTRSANQVRSHAQKFLIKEKRKQKTSKQSPNNQYLLGWLYHNVVAAQYYQEFLKLENVSDGATKSHDLLPESTQEDS